MTGDQARQVPQQVPAKNPCGKACFSAPRARGLQLHVHPMAPAPVPSAGSTLPAAASPPPPRATGAASPKSAKVAPVVTKRHEPPSDATPPSPQRGAQQSTASPPAKLVRSKTLGSIRQQPRGGAPPASGVMGWETTSLPTGASLPTSADPPRLPGPAVAQPAGKPGVGGAASPEDSRRRASLAVPDDALRRRGSVARGRRKAKDDDVSSAAELRVRLALLVDELLFHPPSPSLPSFAAEGWACLDMTTGWISFAGAPACPAVRCTCMHACSLHAPSMLPPCSRHASSDMAARADVLAACNGKALRSLVGSSEGPGAPRTPAFTPAEDGVVYTEAMLAEVCGSFDHR